MSHEYSFYPELCSFPNMSVEVELIAEFDYQPEEKRTFDHPGCDAEVQVTEIRANSITGTDLEKAVARHYNDSRDIDLSHLEIEILENFNANYEDDRGQYLYERQQLDIQEAG